MKSIPIPLLVHCAGPVTTLATCLRALRQDGIVMRFTDFDKSLTLDLAGVGFGSSETFDSGGYTRSAVSSATQSVSNQEILGLLDSEMITDTDMRAGVYDKATIWMFTLNWNSPTDGIIKLQRGELGEVHLLGGRFTVDLFGLVTLLDRTMLEIYGPICRADLGDARCKVDIGALREDAEVSTVTDQRTFVISGAGLARTGPAPNGYGLVKWASGTNTGLAMEIKAWDQATKTVTLYQKMVSPIAPGDQMSIWPGCDKLAATCYGVYSNIANMRGEPNVPGMDSLMQTGLITAGQ